MVLFSMKTRTSTCLYAEKANASGYLQFFNVLAKALAFRCIYPDALQRRVIFAAGEKTGLASSHIHGLFRKKKPDNQMSTG